MSKLKQRKGEKNDTRTLINDVTALENYFHLLSCKDRMKRQLSMNQKADPHQTPNILVSSSWTP